MADKETQDNIEEALEDITKKKPGSSAVIDDLLGNS
jgi:hypothetical protein